VPSYFLTLRDGLEWRLRVVYAPSKRARPLWREEVLPGLHAALTFEGLGAKKSWGYGVFELLDDGYSAGRAPDPAAEAMAAQQETPAVATPRARTASPAAEGLRLFIAGLRHRDAKSQIDRIHRDLARCQPEERGQIAHLLEAKLRELGLREREVRDVLARVTQAVSGG
jgi:hypothetical protein